MLMLAVMLLVVAPDAASPTPDVAAWQKCMNDYRAGQMALYRLPRTPEVLQHCADKAPSEQK